MTAALFSTLSAQASDQSNQPDWYQKPYNYIVVDQPVHDVLVDFGRNLQLPVVISDQVKARTRNQIAAGTAGDFLDQLSSSSELAWYFDGAVLHVNTQSEIENEVVDVSAMETSSVKKMLRTIGSSGHGIFAKLDGGVLRISGPAAFIKLVHQNLDALRPVTAETEVQLYKGGTLQVVTVKSAPGRGHSSGKSHGSIVMLPSR